MFRPFQNNSGLAAALATAVATATPALGEDMINFAASAPDSYDHTMGGGAWEDGTIGTDIVESLQGGDFCCGEIVSYLFQIELMDDAADGRVGTFQFSFSSDTTSNSGAGHYAVVGVQINTGDSGMTSDGDETIANVMTVVPPGPPFDAMDEILLTYDVTGLDAGEVIIVRMDLLLGCETGANPSANAQAQLEDAEIGGEDPSGGGMMTINFMLDDLCLPGACCFPNGSCQVLEEEECEMADGEYQGDGTVCDPNPCPQPVGACCFPDGSCADGLTQAECTAANGDWQGPDTTCDPNPCPQPEFGACCFKDGTCLELMDFECDAAGGKFQGADTICDPNPCPRRHPGWNWVDNLIMLTKNEPCYWSAHTGEPKGVSPFSVLDPAGPGLLPGRPDPDGSRQRVLRGYIIAYAVDANGEEIRWNHLKGDVTIVNYRAGAAWEHNAWSFPVVAAVANGQPTGTPGELNLDGAEYVPGFDQLLLDFQAVRSRAFSGPLGVVMDTDLTLLPVGADLRQETEGPITTKAHFDVWNEYEVKFSGAYRCITCWDQWRLSRHGIPNHFLLRNLQTDKGKARIDGLASQLCDYDNDPKDQKAIGEDINDIVSRDASLLGVAAKLMRFDNDGRAMAGTNLHGLGSESAVIRVDTVGPPPESQAPADGTDPVAELLRAAGLSLDDLAPRSPRKSSDETAAVAGTGGADRVSATEKGSLLIFPKIELRWSPNGRLIQDTFVDISNDYPEDVRIQMYFINGDPPLNPHDAQEKKHMGDDGIDW